MKAVVNSEHLQPLPTVHRFLDEAGDSTFFGKGGLATIGLPGVSLSFAIGMVKFDAPLACLPAQVQRM